MVSGRPEATPRPAAVRLSEEEGRQQPQEGVKRLQIHHLKITRQRQDFLNKLADRLIRENDLIVLEDLKIRNMVRNHHLSKGILDAGWNSLVSRLTSRAAEAGRVVIQVKSKSCSACGPSSMV